VKTVLTAIVLVIFGVVANFLSIWVLNIAGLPGALIALGKTKPGKGRAIIAIILAALGQSYVYLAYTAFIVNWTSGASVRNDVPLGFLLWLPAFLAVFIPIWLAVGAARVEAAERGSMAVQVEALHITTCLAILGFIVFAFVPNLIKLGWGWVPYVR
jgi:hypothetical protein